MRIYRHFLHTWRESLQQLSIALVSLFPLAIQALPFIALVALGVLADPQSAPRQYFTTLWGYQLLLHSWLLLQKDGIRASNYHDYLQMLPISRWQQRRAEWGLILRAGHLLLLAPVLFWLYLLGIHIDGLFDAGASTTATWQDFIPLTTLVILNGYYSGAAVYRRYPWLSLLLLPLVLLPFSASLHIANIAGIWLVGITIEHLIDRRCRCGWLRRLTRATALQHLARKLLLPLRQSLSCQLYFNADRQRHFAQLLRLVALLLLLIISDSFVRQVNPPVQFATGNVFCFLIGLLLASKLVDLQQLHADYQLYLACLPLTHWQQQWRAVGYVWCYCALPFGLIGWFNLFSGSQWALLLLFFMSAQLGLLINRLLFIALPSTLALLCWWAS